MKCTALLIQEHRTILRALDVLNAMANRVEAGEAPAREDVNGLLEFLRRFADELHQAKEENIVFPAFANACRKDEFEAAKHMLFEHDRDRSLIQGVQEALETKRASDFVYFSNRLVDLLGAHTYKEEQVLFPMIDRALSKEQDEQISRRLKMFDRNAADCMARDRMVRQLSMLEWKYLGRVVQTAEKHSASPTFDRLQHEMYNGENYFLMALERPL
jgi:hemerythrin-like domain-containing protein